MKKLILIFITIILFDWGTTFAQASTVADVEFQIICLVDSISPSNQVYFNRRVSLINPALYSDHNQNMTGTYTVTGTVVMCHDVVGVKECWLKTDTVPYLQQEFSATPGDGKEDFWIVELSYIENKSISGYAASTSPLYNAPQIIPLAYPYGNSSWEATRFVVDIRKWLDCKGICYVDDPVGAIMGTTATPTGLNTPYSSLRGLRIVLTTFGIQIYGVLYSYNFLDKSKYTYYRAGTTTNQNHICDVPFDVYRKANNGAILYGINYKGEVKYPPFTGLLTKVDCGFKEARADDCNRPSGGTECYVAQLDTALCSYYCTIRANETIDSFFINGRNMIPTGYKADGTASFAKGPQGLTDTLNNYLEKGNTFGKVSIDNIYDLTYGWKVTAKWTTKSFDSIGTNVKKYYFKKLGCTQQKFYEVRRNELGGIISCNDEQGDIVYLPESAIRINCNNVDNYTDCINQNRQGNEFLTNAAKVFDLSKFHSFSLSVLTGTATYAGVDQSGGSNSNSIDRGYNESITAETKCRYLSGTITLTAPSTCLIKISYVW